MIADVILQDTVLIRMGYIGAVAHHNKTMERDFLNEIHIQQPAIMTAGINLLQLFNKPCQRHVGTADTCQSPLAVIQRHTESTIIVTPDGFIMVGIGPESILFFPGSDIPGF